MSEGEGRPLRVGIISDTHGRLPYSIEDAFAVVDAILHAGDVGEGGVLDLLRSIAPVTAVRGNCDAGGEAALLPSSADVRLGGVRFLVAHEFKALLREIDPIRAGARVVVTGHSHHAHAEERGGVLYLDPGSASQGRGRPRSVAVVTVHADGRLEHESVELTWSGRRGRLFARAVRANGSSDALALQLRQHARRGEPRVVVHAGLRHAAAPLSACVLHGHAVPLLRARSTARTTA